MLVTASYMVCALKSLEVLYLKMIHLKCLARGLHRVAEFIRSQFPNVNVLISKCECANFQYEKNILQGKII